MLDLNDLRLFVHIVDHQGILRAGRALRLPKSTISRRLAALEGQLKTRLVTRGGDEFTLTAAGEEVYALGRAMVDAAETAEERLLARGETIEGQVAIGVSCLIANMLGRFTCAMMAAHPGLSFAVESGENATSLNGDGLDIHLRAHHWRLTDSPLIQRRICRNPMILVARSDLTHGLAGVETPDGLRGAALLAFSADPRQQLWPMREDAGGPGLDWTAPPHLVSADTALIRQAALDGAGIALLPEYAVRSDLADGTLHHLLPQWRGPAVAITLLTPPRHLMNRTLRRVADELALRAKAEIFPQSQAVPFSQPAVLETRTPNFTELSSGVITQDRPNGAVPLRSDEFNPAESETTMTPMMKAAALAVATAAAGLTAPAFAQDAAGPLVLYTNDFEGVLTERFEADTGRDIDVVQMSGGELLARIAAETNNPQWDALIFNGSYTLHGLDLQGQLLRGTEPANLSNLNEVGKRYLPENRSWFPIGLVASCVLLYRNDLVSAPPRSFDDLADSRFNGLFGMADPAVAAPAYPCVASVFQDRGKDKAEALFGSFFQNGMRVFRTNGPTGRALTSGDIHVALITSQVAYSLKAAGEPVEVVWPAEGAPGAVRGAAIQAKTSRPAAAKAFIEWLLEPATQTYLANAVPSDGLFEPTVNGAVRRADGPPAGSTYRVASDAFAVEHEEAIKTWFADQNVN